MGKIFKQLARHWAACLAVVALLFVQAYCDLSLPDYTSKIVDTGIQQGGIKSPLPETVRQSTLDALSLLMSEEDADALQNAYGYYLQDDGVLKLRSDLTDAERTALEEAVTTPDIVLYMAAAQNANAPAGQNAAAMAPLSGYQSEEETAGDEAETMTAAPTAEDLDAVCGQFAALAQMPGFSREMIQQQLASAMEQVDETTLSSMASQATLLVSLEYEAQGVSHDVQMAYLFRVGGQMLALTLLMVVVAILVGLIASRVSASIGRELRRETFSSVIHFSNAEIENFSTASLITRTTNDIQQAQFTCVIRSHSGHRRRDARHPGQHRPCLDHRAGRGRFASAHHGSDEHRHAQVQDHADPGGQAESRQPRDPDRRDAGACIQPRIL